jgi:hypothetical protein
MEGDARAILAMADRADFRGQRYAQFELALCRGLAALRAGRWDAAVEALRTFRDTVPDTTMRAAAGYYLALAQKGRGDGAAAEAAMGAAEAEWGKVVRAGEDDIGVDCQDWLICQVARREATRAMGRDGISSGK